MEKKNYKIRALFRVSMTGLFLSLLFLFLFTETAFASVSSNKTREIYIVYDDSGSMYDDTYWSEAKYAVEVFAAMMGSDDTVYIYPMSRYDAPIILKGSKNADNNVQKVSNMDGVANGTPFAAVQAAADAIMLSDADDKWLVVFSDGGFNDDAAADWDSKLLNYVGQNEVKVVYTSIGFENPLLEVKKEGFYPYEARYDHNSDSSPILEKMTEIASRVFNYKSIQLTGTGSGTVGFDADVPLSKIIIFAQGADSRVGEVQVNGTPLQDYKDRSVSVKVDRNTGYADLEIAPGLNGIVYTASAEDEMKPFDQGNYSFSCNTDNVQVFVEPGVTVEATLRNADGETINLEKDTSGVITEGEWTIDVRLINPLTGREVNPSDSSILSGAQKDVVVKTDDGTIQEYADGDTITVSGQELELYGRTQYQGINGVIEKTSRVHQFKIDKSRLRFTFSSPGGYNLDAVMLHPNPDMTFTVTVGSKPLTAAQAEKLKLKIKNTQGIKWEAEPLDDKGTYRLVPGYAGKKGLSAVIPGEVNLEISGSVKADGEKREGTGTVKVNIFTESQAGLVLELVMPEEQYFDANSTGKYMFDARVRGVPGSGEERPYILVKVTAKDSEGHTRQLSNEEWSAGTDGFSYHAESVSPAFLWRMIRFLTIGGQGLDFEAIQGTEPSTYKLYLDGISELNVLPNTSDLEVTMKIAFENGAFLRGSETGTVTVRPVEWWKYLLYFMVLAALLVMAVIIIIRELTKPRIPKDFKPVIEVTKSLAGTPQPPLQPRHNAAARRIHRLSLFKPEECRVVFDSRDTRMTIRFTVVATGNGRFRLGDHQLANFLPVRKTVRFNRMEYAKVEKDPGVEFETADSIVYTRTIGAYEYRVRLTF